MLSCSTLVDNTLHYTQLCVRSHDCCCCDMCHKAFGRCAVTLVQTATFTQKHIPFQLFVVHLPSELNL